MFEYDVAIVKAKSLSSRSYSEQALQATLDSHARDRWQLRFITPERERLLVTFEGPAEPRS